MGERFDAAARVGERGRFRDAVDRRPDLVAGDLTGVGKEEEGARDERGVEEVAPGAAEDFLTDKHAETNGERDLPKGNRRGADQREKEPGNEEAFVDFVAIDSREEDFPEETDDHRNDIDRKMIGQTVDKASDHAVNVENPEARTNAVEPCEEGAVPVVRHSGVRAEARNQTIRLQTDVVNSHERARNQRVNDEDHRAFEVVAVANVDGAGSLLPRREEEGVGRVVKRVQERERLAFGEEFFPGGVEGFAQ